MMRRIQIILSFIAVFMVATPAFAVNPEEILDDPALEERARVISAELRCLVCQNQSIDDSDAELAQDLRVLVRERLVSGDSNSEVINYVVARYGEFVLLKPQFSARNMILWFTPLIVFILGFLAMVAYTRSQKSTSEDTKLSAHEEQRLAEILGDSEGRHS